MWLRRAALDLVWRSRAALEGALVRCDRTTLDLVRWRRATLGLVRERSTLECSLSYDARTGGETGREDTYCEG